MDPGPSTAAEVVELGSASGADSDPDTIQRPGSKKRGRKTKHIKEHFTKVGAGPVGKSKRWCYKCKYCSNEFTNSQNSALVSHILHSCTEVPASIKSAVQLKEAQAGPDVPLPASSKGQIRASRAAQPNAQGSQQPQQSITAFRDRYLTQGETDECNIKLVRFLAATGASFRVVDSVYFLDFVQSLRPLYFPAGALDHMISIEFARYISALVSV